MSAPQHRSGQLSASLSESGPIGVTPPTGRRSNSLANRARLVAAARASVTSDAELNLHAIAKEAGVGQGTLYRHFPTRGALLAEVYRSEVDELVTTAGRLMIVHEPAEALALWLDCVMRYATVKRGVLAAVEASLWQDLTAKSLGPIGAALTTLLDAGKHAGAIRTDADADDVILLLGTLTRIDSADYERRAQHVLAIIMDGLRRSS